MTSDKIDWRDPIVLGIAGCFVVESSLNAIAGFDLVGGLSGGIKAFLFAFGGILLALLGAWSGKEGVGLFWRRGILPVVGGLMLVVSVACCGLSLVASWRALGMSFADGAIKRDRAATQGQVAGDSLKQKRDERAKLGTPRDPATIEAAISAELGKYLRGARDTVGSVTRDCADPSLAPQTCRAVNALKTELTGARRARVLDDEIGTGAIALGSQAIATPGSENMILGAITGADQRQGLLLAILAFTVLVNFFANFGFMLLELVRGTHGSHGPNGGGGGGGLEADYYREMDRRAAQNSHLLMAAPSPRMMLPAPAAGNGPVWGGPLQPGGGGGQSSSAAPVTINNYTLSPGSGGAGSAADLAKAQAAASAAEQQAAVEIRARERRDLPAISGDAPPVDRSRVADISPEEREAADVMLAFRAACVVDAPGGIVSELNLYKRYQAWAGERAVAAPSFFTLFPKVTGVEILTVGGLLHARGVALRAGAALRVA